MAFFPSLNRRALLLGGASGIAASVVALDGAQAQNPAPTPAAPTHTPAPAPAPAPALILRAAPGNFPILTAPAKETAALAYNGQLAGPVLRVKRGDAFSVRLKNDLDEPTSLHWYGLHGFNAFDGVAGLTQEAVKPGESYDYAFAPKNSGLHWFHPLVPGFAASQLERGLAGMLLVEEDKPQAADRDLAVFLDDWRLKEDGALAVPFNEVADTTRAGRLGNRLTVNGKPAPQMLVLPPRSRVRLRILNVANARIMPMRFERFGAATVIAVDGQPTEPFDPLRKQVTLAPGARFEVMVDLPAEAGKESALTIGLGDGFPVLRFQTEGAPLEARPPVAAIPPNDLPPGITLQSAERSVLEITGGMPALAPNAPAPAAEDMRKAFPDPLKVFSLNYGKNNGFSSAPLLRVKSGKPCVLAVSNRTAWTQVLHMHGHHFRYLHPYDDGWEPYWLDTLVVAPGQTIRIAFDAGAPGKWAVRSSIMEHFEAGVASWFEVS